MSMNDPKNPSPAPLARNPNRGLYRLLAWLSPGFPVGSFAFSHGLEAAAASGAVRDRYSLQLWISAIVASGGGRIDADVFSDAYRASSSGDIGALTGANRRGVAFRATAETRLETTAQGEAFLATCRAAWPSPVLDCWAQRISERGEAVCYAAAVGAATAQAGIALDCALLGYLQALASNLVSAGLRLGIIGQTDGQRIVATLEPVISAAVAGALTRDPDGFGSATFAVELASMDHETQYTRLFRS
ncbi:MAG TPA: urease accessory protein UreF [Stellaceae bacterium]|jgi:urease accessory protein|nr:urease accessory protein UreF [Stellaceae bacterium]